MGCRLLVFGWLVLSSRQLSYTCFYPRDFVPGYSRFARYWLPAKSTNNRQPTTYHYIFLSIDVFIITKQSHSRNMAEVKTYKCASCGYECKHYSGRGFFGQKISSVVCMSCKTVQQITVGGIIADVAPSFSSEYGRLCPNCMSQNLTIWDEKTCPKCGGTMFASNESEFWT